MQDIPPDVINLDNLDDLDPDVRNHQDDVDKRWLARNRDMQSVVVVSIYIAPLKKRYSSVVLPVSLWGCDLRLEAGETFGQMFRNWKNACWHIV